MKIVRRFSSAHRQEIVEKSKQCLWTTEGKPGLLYLRDSRKITEKVIRSFDLGFIPQHKRHQLAGRIIFPIYDASRNLIAISSRATGSEESLLPVYWHEGYEKRFYLYAIGNAKEWMRKWKFVIICEGQFDVLQLHSRGMKNSVALCGTRLSDIQLSVIFRYCEEIVLVLDKDKNLAGQHAAERIIGDRQSKRHSLKVKDCFNEMPRECSVYYNNKFCAVSLPESGDPDEFVRNYGINSFCRIVKKELLRLRNHV